MTSLFISVTAGKDFDILTLAMLEFNELATKLPVTIAINDDSILENTEDFFSILNTSDPAVTLAPQQATINIMEDGDGTYVTHKMNIIVALTWHIRMCSTSCLTLSVTPMHFVAMTFSTLVHYSSV